MSSNPMPPDASPAVGSVDPISSGTVVGGSFVTSPPAPSPVSSDPVVPGPTPSRRLRPADPLPRLYRWRTNLFQAPLFFVFTAIFGTVALAVSPFDKTGQLQHRVARAWARACVFVSGSRLVVRGADNLLKYPVAVYAANHTSYMDTPVVFASMPVQFRILAKKELWSTPFIGWYLNRSGQIPIDTENPRTTLSSLGIGVKALRAGMPLFVFPEGARTPDGELQAFLSGAAYLAIRAQVPLIPVALTGVYDLLPIHAHHFYPGSLTLTAGEPIDTKGLTARNTEGLTQRLRDSIHALYNLPKSIDL